VVDEQAPDGAVAGVRASSWQWESRTEPYALIGVAVVGICALVAAKVLLRGLAQDALYLVGGFLLLGPLTIVLVSLGIAAGRGLAAPAHPRPTQVAALLLLGCGFGMLLGLDAASAGGVAFAQSVVLLIVAARWHHRGGTRKRRASWTVAVVAATSAATAAWLLAG